VPGLHIVKIALTVRAKLPEYALQQHLPAPIATLGEQLARQAADYVKEQELGYFPALEYFQQQGGVDAYLLDAAEQISLLAVTMTKQEVIRILTPVFSSVSMGTIQSLAYTMPAVRPNQPHAMKRLAEHYIPDWVKFEMTVSLIQRREPPPDIDRAAKQMAWRWLKEAFDDMDITSARVIKDD
jgi:hypothetical protein